MFYGIVKYIVPDRGCGFIAQEGAPDVYFHATIMPEADFRRILPDQPVMFELAKRSPDEKPSERRGLRAAVVKLIDRLPGGILPPPPKTLTARHHPKARGRKATWKRKIIVGSRKDNSPGAASLPKSPES
jgi:cold shock CspA family protein